MYGGVRGAKPFTVSLYSISVLLLRVYIRCRMDCFAYGSQKRVDVTSTVKLVHYDRYPAACAKLDPQLLIRYRKIRKYRHCFAFGVARKEDYKCSSHQKITDGGYIAYNISLPIKFYVPILDCDANAKQ